MITAMTYLIVFLLVAAVMSAETIRLLFHDGRGPQRPPRSHFDDPRFRSTFAAAEKALRRGEHMLRYASEDDFGLPETAFNVCTFWLI